MTQPNRVIDLRSDTVTQPTAAMRGVMAAADVGDDVYGEDPTVNQLEAMAADLLGKEASVFAPSGTQSNLLALLSHCQRGDEYLVGQTAHTYRYEAGGAAVLGSIQPQPIPFAADGTLPLAEVAAYIKPDDIHFARTRLLCLENTHNGLALPLAYLDEVGDFGDAHGLLLHLDGARIFNAAEKTGKSARHLAGSFDSVSICLSKGLGAPVGSILCGDGDLIQRARRWRKMLGGGMRQAGILAAAGAHALTHHVDRLSDDHANARRLADGLIKIPGLDVDFAPAQTHMVFLTLSPAIARQLAAYLADHRVLIHPGPRVRLVVHLDIDSGAVDRVVDAVTAFFKTFPLG